MRLPTISLIFLFQFAWGSVLTEPQILSLKKLYHYNHPTGVSEFSDSRFYVHPQGAINFQLEVEELIKGFENPKDQNSYACLFPARQKRLEEFLNKKFPTIHCTELEYWRENLKSTHISLLFSGAYSQNPASLFGHTLFRISNRSNPKRSSALLSYAIGFLASTGDDGTLNRIRKGLTGQYPGYYNLEPFYIKLGLYNNSESRDIWEEDLNLSQSEVDFFIDHLWEVSRYAKPYYFIKRNCSFHLLRFMEALRPELNLVQHHNFETLPHESVYTFIRAGLTTDQKRFYSSLKRKMTHLFNQMNDSQMRQFQQGQKNFEELKKIEDTLVLDALIYHWQMINYQKNLNLTVSQKNFMETTFKKRALISDVSNHNQMVSENDGPLAPYNGHRPQQMKFATTDKNSSWLSYRHGVHGFTQSSLGFDDFSSIEYLGLKYQAQNKDSHQSQYQILFADIRSFESTEAFEPKKSWMINTRLNSRSFFRDSPSDYLSFKGGLGYSKKWRSTLLYALLLADSEVALENEYAHGIRGGLLLGFKTEFNKHRLIVESEIFTKDSVLKIDWGYSLTQQISVYLSYQPDLLIDKNSTQLILEANF